jgi:TolA-binding protein
LIQLRQAALFVGSVTFVLLLSGCGSSAEKPVADSASPAEQATPGTPGSTINYELLDLQRSAAEMQATGTGDEGARLQDTQTKIKQMQNQIQMDTGNAGK